MRNERGDRLVCGRCTVAESIGSRLRGLLGRRTLEPDEGLLLRPAGSIHTWFMRFPIDAVFLDRELRVLAIAGNTGPWRVRGKRAARAVLELPAGAARKREVVPGDRLRLVRV